MNKKNLGLSLLSLSLIGSGLIQEKIYAHGFVSSPVSRSRQGQIDKDYSLYGRVIYEPQSLEGSKNFPTKGPKDGEIAGAGISLGTKLNEQSSTRWKKQKLHTGVNSFTWTYTASHPTTKWHYYITKVGWDQNKKLTRADLELIGTVAGDGKQASTNLTHKITIPEDHQGYHIILAVWDVADTNGAFYQVIDADIKKNSITTPPAPPIGLKLDNVTSSIATISWDSQTDATSFIVYRDGEKIAEVNSPKFVDNKVEANKTYTYQIMAKKDNQTSGKSPELTVKTLSVSDVEKPTTPSGLHKMNIAENSVDLMWGESTHTSGIKEYQIFQDGKKVATTNKTKYNLSNLKHDTEYKIFIKAVANNGEISNESNVLSIRTLKETEKPGTPGPIILLDTTKSSISFMWIPSTHSSGIKEYEIYRDNRKIAVTTRGNFKDNNLNKSTEYSYIVKAIANDGSVSNISDELRAITK